ncbi:MAG: PAS domain S-box protein [Thermodesulfobacteriota bacterium]|nr:PAS domain S-box protein [Thermodesulfobacteriota bacterium]
MKQEPGLKQSIFERQVESVYKHLPSSTVANIVNASILIYIQWTVVSHGALLAWFGAIVAVSLLRLISGYLFKKHVVLSGATQAGRIYVVGLFISGLTWGSSAIFLFPKAEFAHQIIVTFVVGGMVAGASASTSALKGAFFFYCIPSLCPLIFNYFSMESAAGNAMGFMLTVYALFTIATAQQVYRAILSSIVFQLKNEQEAATRRAAEANLDQEREFLKAVLFNVEDGIVACNREGLLTLFNRAAREFHGIVEEQIGADKWASRYDLYLPDGETQMRKEEVPLYRAFREEEVQHQEMMIIPKDGKKRILLASGQPLFDENKGKIGAVVSMHDITEERRAQENLQAAFDHLEVKVAERTEELIAVNRELRTEIEERRKAEEEKEGLIVRLQEALERIKTLSGIVPICMYCKEIRDDKGYWNKLEKFIAEHSEAQFSHCVCPNCMKKLHPNLVDEAL